MKKKTNKFKIDKDHFRVTIFGSARTKPGHPTYKLVYKLAKLIAKEKIDIITGGGPGLMDAASSGHYAGDPTNHNHSIGLTIKLPMEQHDGQHLEIKKEFSRFSGRLDTFMSLSNAVVVAPGGIGTCLEFFYTWQLTQVKHICPIPIILLGPMWKGLIEWVKKQPLKKQLLSPKDFENIYLVKTNAEAMKIIKATKKQFEKDPDSCDNLKLYGI
ncbi:hypothetical protein COV82_06540 [Candidatus Peregrinibacteria bacterium CG11_big_fil_rev_8_21_14_0_20_46_8]|nr:MAG: hypothetical protein COV82_06540 [Candidatus Peregrinibacteria bacterium CG11_big_fil_rev_8_21_14_0_20_46_8]